jgi:hypothetical protein
MQAPVGHLNVYTHTLSSTKYLRMQFLSTSTAGTEITAVRDPPH